MESILEIAYAVLVIWWALCVIALFVLLAYLISIVVKARSLVKQTQQTYEQAIFFAMSPLQKLTDWLSTSVEEDDEDW